MGFLQKSWKDNWVRRSVSESNTCKSDLIQSKVGVVLDTLWSGIVIAPLVVLYWRGTWDLLEDFVRLHLLDFLEIKTRASAHLSINSRYTQTDQTNQLLKMPPKLPRTG